MALSGVVAGNTALCSVGKTSDDLHYRGYDIIDLAGECEFEEVAHLLIHGTLPTCEELSRYKEKLRALRGLSESVKAILEVLPAAAHPMDVLRTGVSALGCIYLRENRIAMQRPGTLPIASWHARARCCCTGITLATMEADRG